MANYPSLPQGRESTWVPDSGTITDISQSGLIRTRRLYDTSVWTGKIIHHITSEADRTTLKTFYTTNRDLEFTFAYASDPSAEAVTYTCRFVDEPMFIWRGSDYWEAHVEMYGKMD